MILDLTALMRVSGWWVPRLLPYLLPGTDLFYVGSGDQTQVFLLIRQALHPLNHLPALTSSNWMLSINVPLDVWVLSFTISLLSLSLCKKTTTTTIIVNVVLLYFNIPSWLFHGSLLIFSLLVHVCGHIFCYPLVIIVRWIHQILTCKV